MLCLVCLECARRLHVHAESHSLLIRKIQMFDPYNALSSSLLCIPRSQLQKFSRSEINGMKLQRSPTGGYVNSIKTDSRRFVVTSASETEMRPFGTCDNDGSSLCASTNSPAFRKASGSGQLRTMACLCLRSARSQHKIQHRKQEARSFSYAFWYDKIRCSACLF